MVAESDSFRFRHAWAISLLRFLGKDDNAVCFGVRKRSEKTSIRNGEYGGIDADPKGERQDD
jgi:hypothetical protein